jgi:protein-arginine kinase activator protein McsA
MIMTSTGKNGSKHELDDPKQWQNMSCATCTNCYMDAEHFRKYGIVRCYFGGPFHYEKVIDD